MLCNDQQKSKASLRGYVQTLPQLLQQEARQDGSGGRSGSCIAEVEGKTKIDFKEDIVFLTALILVRN